jgi:hypothetical protein
LIKISEKSKQRSKNIEGFLDISLLHFTYSQFWLNIHVDYRHFGYITKLGPKTLSPSITTSSVVASAIYTRLVSFFERGNPSPSCFLLESICFLHCFSLSRVSVFVHLGLLFSGQAEQEDHH